MSEQVKEVVEQADELGAPNIGAAIEALLLLTDEPMPAIELAQITRAPLPDVERVLHELSVEYTEQMRGFDLREVAGGWRFYTRSECSPLIERWVVDGQQAKLTQAALETLSVIAYRQPVTRGRVSAVRGVNIDGVIKTLLTRGLIQEAGTENESGAIFYKTTSFFLERLGISSLADLPPLAEHIPDLADLDAVLESVASGD
ncbi:MAG: SMC-Scp complex subunit ScpB [Candidatus Nanopelagicales bacterium]|jgi:segregation and condensation protein B